MPQTDRIPTLIGARDSYQGFEAFYNIVITLTKDHVLYWDEEVTSLKELRAYLKEAGGDKPVLLRADRHAYVSKLIEIWDLCRDTGYREVHIATIAE